MYPYSDRPAYAHAKQQVENYYSYPHNYAYGMRSPYTPSRFGRDTMPYPSLSTQSSPTAPPQRPKLTTSLWEDEGTICYQVDARGICVARRQDNDMVNGTKLLNVTGMSRGKRDGILKNEQGRVVVKVGAMHLKGVWVTFARAKALAEQFKITEDLHPLFVDDPGVYFYTSPVPLTQPMQNYYIPSTYISPSQDVYSPYNNCATSHHHSSSTVAHPANSTPSIRSTSSHPLPPAPSVPSMISTNMYYKPESINGGICMSFDEKADASAGPLQSSSQPCATQQSYEVRTKQQPQQNYDTMSRSRPSSQYEPMYNPPMDTNHMVEYSNRRSGGASSIFSTMTADDSAPTTPANFISYSYDTNSQPSFSVFNHNVSSPATPPQQLERHDQTYARRNSLTVQPFYNMPQYKPTIQNHGPTMTNFYDDDLRSHRTPLSTSTTTAAPQW
ncbi:hypothetical protein DFQ28_003317 [Apophysomyces sp. BC1034]|nr:hypothetical protein DFQ30_011097 [Apophysomyces sp. BC1015]KAG0174720.1 hypothetical protein DFQ29_007399 [Apophysomyces sp. BC1021]KAG0189503.1 hypothetical protein DFQ28_003317 [Apophysomyces sp. BC1034]